MDVHVLTEVAAEGSKTFDRMTTVCTGMAGMKALTPWAVEVGAAVVAAVVFHIGESLVGFAVLTTAAQNTDAVVEEEDPAGSDVVVVVDGLLQRTEQQAVGIAGDVENAEEDRAVIVVVVVVVGAVVVDVAGGKDRQGGNAQSSPATMAVGKCLMQTQKKLLRQEEYCR